MRRLSLFRSTTFRMSMLAGLLFAVAAIALLVAVFETATETLEEQMIASAESDARNIARFLGEGDIDDILEFTSQVGADDDFRYLVVDRAGKVVIDQIGMKTRPTGAVTVATNDTRPIIEATRPRQNSGLVGFGMNAPSGGYVFVAQDDEQLAELRAALMQTVAMSVVAIMLFALVGGAAVSYLLLRRLEAFSRVADGVTSGHMSGRMPVSARGDEFDKLALQLNAMLNQLEAGMDALKQVSSDIAHDLRTPLTRLRQRLEEIAVSASQDQRNDLVSQALRDANNMLEVFASLLRISQIEAGAARTNFTRVNLSVIMQELAEIYEAVAADGMRTLEASIVPGVEIEGDRALLQQMFTNLIENALTHTPPGSKIALALAPTVGGWRASVADDGPGIPFFERERIFDRFYRLEKSRTTPGTGLGLSLVRAIARAHGLRIFLDTKPAATIFSIEPDSAALSPSEAEA